MNNLNAAPLDAQQKTASSQAMFTLPIIVLAVAGVMAAGVFSFSLLMAPKFKMMFEDFNMPLPILTAFVLGPVFRYSLPLLVAAAVVKEVFLKNKTACLIMNVALLVLALAESMLLIHAAKIPVSFPVHKPASPNTSHHISDITS